MYELEKSSYFYLFTLLPLVVVAFLYLLFWKRRAQRNFADSALLKQLSPNYSSNKPILKFVVVLLALSALIIGLVNPQIGTKLETVKREGIDIVFAVDVSKSMLAEDIAPNRIEKSKQIVSQIINQLGTDRIGIIAYAGSAYPVLPITTDYSIAKMFLQDINTDMVSSQGTAINEAIEVASNYFDDSNQTNRLLVLLSDGEDHSEDAVSAAEKAKELGMKIVTIGIGTPNGGPIPLKENGVVSGFLRNKQNEVVVTKMNIEILEKIATITQGKYIDGTNTKVVLDDFGNILNSIEKTEFETQQISGFESQYQWFIGFAFLLLFLDIFILERKTEWLRKLNLFNEKTA